MGGLLTKTQRLRESRWVFPIQEAVRQVVPPEYVGRGELEELTEEEAIAARAIEVGSALAAPPGYPDEPPETAQQARITLKYYRLFSDWLPRLSLGPAIFMLILNIILPGTGTLLFSLKWYSPEDFIIPTTKSQRSAIVITCALYGVMQLLLAPFLFGWIWSIATGVLAVQQAKWVAISEAYSHVIEERLKEMLTDRAQSARQHARQTQLGSASSDVTTDSGGGAITDISMLSSTRSSAAIHRPLNSSGGAGNQGPSRSSSHSRTTSATTAQQAAQILISNQKQALGQFSSTRPSGKNQSLTDSSVNKPRTPLGEPTTTPKIPPKRFNPGVHPAAEGSPNSEDLAIVDDTGGGVSLSSRDPSFIHTANGQNDDDDELVGFKAMSSGKTSAASRTSSHKSRKSALSLSLNRISPAPTAAAQLTLSQKVEPSDEQQEALEQAPDGDEPAAASVAHKSVTFSRSVSERQIAKNDAWGGSGTGSSNKLTSSDSNNASNHQQNNIADNPQSMYGDESHSGDEVIDLKTQRNRSSSRESGSKKLSKSENDVMAVEDI